MTSFKDGIAQMCGLGDYWPVARFTQPAAADLVERTNVQSGDRVLEVTAGYGNASVLAARRGAVVTATDLSQRMVEIGGQRTAAEGLDVRWGIADVEKLGEPDASFDVVLTAFGVEYTTPEVVLPELRRVLAPGGRLGLAQWGSTGLMADLVSLLTRWVPSPSEHRPLDWGDPEIMRARLGEYFEDIEISPRKLSWEFTSVAEARVFWEENFPPTIALLKVLGDSADDLRDLLDEFGRNHVRSNGNVLLEFTYLVAVGVAR